MDTVYIEKEIANQPRTLEILARLKKARHVPINHYTDVFNATAQNFRIQKQNPALILAKKHGKLILPAPLSYHIGGNNNYYFSHMLNCIYDCRYCYLQGMYRSGNYVVFVNYDSFFDDIAQQTELNDDPSWFFSGYDCDSLALEPLTGFIANCLDTFTELPNAWLEIRTKSTQIRPLINRQPIDNCVVAFSLSPQAIVQAEEHKTPSLAKRITALQQLQRAGWRIGLRFDPLIYASNFEQLYAEMFDDVFAALDATTIHSVSLGPFRLPKPNFKKMQKLYPESRLFAAELLPQGSMITYARETEQSMLSYCESALLNNIKREQYFPCVTVS